MSDLRSMLERADRAIETIPMPDDGLGRLGRRRDLRRRNRRIGSALLAAVIALAAVGSVVSVFRSGKSVVPANEPITPRSIGRLELKWKVDASGNGELLGASDAAEGIVVTTGSPGSVLAQVPKGESAVNAFAEDCGSHGSTCQPLWTATVHGSAWPPTVADGYVFVAADDLTVFPLHCRTDGGLCSPTWVGKLVSLVGTQLVVSGGVVYVTSGASPNVGRVYAFSERCGSGGAVCRPLWRSPVFGRPLLTGPVSNGLLYVGVWAASDKIDALNELYAFPVSCAEGGPICRPAWRGVIPTRFASVPAASNGVLYVGTARSDGSGTLRGYDAACGVEPACKPLWTVDQPDGLNIPSPVAGDGIIVTASRSSGRIRAWKPNPAGGPPQLLWTACCPTLVADTDPVIADGLVYVASAQGVTAYPVDCVPRDGVCKPVWTSSVPGAGSVRVADGLVLEGGSNGTLSVYGIAAPSTPTPTATSRRWTPVFYAGVAVLLASLALVRRRRSMR